MTDKATPHIKPEFIVNLRGKDFVLYAGLLDLAHQRGIKRLETEVVRLPDASNSGECVVRASLTLKDGEVFTDYGDANPGNVNRPIAQHIIRMASTRAKARVLRDATNIGLTALEELGGSVDEEEREGQGPGGPGRRPDAEGSARRRPAPALVQGATDRAGMPAAAPQGNGHGAPGDASPRGIKMTDAQLRAIRSIARSKGMTPQAIEEFAQRQFNTPLEALNIDEASHVIKELQRL